MALAANEEKPMITNKLFSLALAALAAAALTGAAVSPAAAAPPSNDFFANAAVVTTFPFSATVVMTEATNEGGEPFYCNYSTQTVWYRFTAASNGWYGADTQGSPLYGTGVTVYRDAGGGISGLNELGCSYYDGTVVFRAIAGSTYYIQGEAPCCGYTGSIKVNIAQVPPPVPIAYFYYYPYDPSIFDTVQFQDNSYDPGQIGILNRAWDYGDGTTGAGSYVSHRYAADGNYNVRLEVTTIDGRVADTTRTVAVRTHDVAITRFKTPESAALGQTRSISVGVSSSRYPESVQVQLYKSAPGGYQNFVLVGALHQFVPVRSSNRTTDFDFSYTFSNEDATLGKVTFMAQASLDTARDALAADNQAISSPVKINKNGQTLTGNGVAQTEADPLPAVPQASPLALLAVTPNPTRVGDLAIRLSLASDAAATLEVLDIAGRSVMKRNLNKFGAGVHVMSVTFDRRPEPGIYLVLLTQDGRSVSSKIGILK
jgi:PKD domain-containing protein